jgi:putative membrane protein
MLMHMGVVAVAAPLLAIGIAGGPLDPVPAAPRFFAPIPISLLELVVVWAWHAPKLHDVARNSLGGLIAEQSMFLVCALLLWLAAFSGGSTGSGVFAAAEGSIRTTIFHRSKKESQPLLASHDKGRAAAGIVGLLLTMMHMVLLGALLALTPRPLYEHAETHSHLSPLEDQHLGGAIMLIGGGVSYLLGGLSLTVRLLRGDPNDPETHPLKSRFSVPSPPNQSE